MIPNKQDRIAQECIRIGLNMCSGSGYDGSALIPSYTGLILEKMGTCRTCVSLDTVEVCRNPQSMYDVDMSDRLDWFCAEQKDRDELRD